MLDFLCWGCPFHLYDVIYFLKEKEGTVVRYCNPLVKLELNRPLSFPRFLLFRDLTQTSPTMKVGDSATTLTTPAFCCPVGTCCSSLANRCSNHPPFHSSCPTKLVLGHAIPNKEKLGLLHEQNLDLLKMPGKSSKNTLPNGGLMVIYQRVKNHLKQIPKNSSYRNSVAPHPDKIPRPSEQATA